ncbi:helix-turn-helix domain-containing protein [Candidatus Avelusimicrobium caledoniensis]|uniref:helix-turn-helix domain-containing protein n=1 Tax=Candidatus Avelusimicrobium caledoniensis TaxID=3416220 RepID=UPI003D144358
MDNIIHTIAINLRKERTKQGLTQAKLAEKAELHNNYIGLIERAQCNISVIILEKLANALSIRITDLLENQK